jgi:hypothetical protein
VCHYADDFRDGESIEWDASRQVPIEKRYRAGEVVASAARDGVLVARDDASGSFVQWRFRAGERVAPAGRRP